MPEEGGLVLSESPSAPDNHDNASDRNTSRDPTSLGRVAKPLFKVIEVIGWLGGTVQNSSRFVRIYLGDGLVRVKAGEVVEHTGQLSTRAWGTWESMVPMNHQRPDHPPNLATGKVWSFIGPNVKDVQRVGLMVSLLSVLCREDDVIVLREGLKLPTKTVVNFVNGAHAVLVLRVLQDRTEYHYLHHDLVMSAGEEESLMEWGVGRPFLGNAALGIGGTLLVALAEQVWQPAIIGTLLVAVASYRVQGVLTQVLRVCSPEWKGNKLVPSGIHGTERVLQLVLLVLVALADLLEDRMLLLASLISASAYVILVEIIGQAVTTWGWPKIRASSHEFVTMLVRYGLAHGLLSWMIYTFAGAIFCVCLGLAILLIFVVLARTGQSYSHLHRNPTRATRLFIFATFGVAGYVASMDWKEAVLKWSNQSLQPWRWSLTRIPGSGFEAFRLTAHWIGVVVLSFLEAGQFSRCNLEGDFT